MAYSLSLLQCKFSNCGHLTQQGPEYRNRQTGPTIRAELTGDDTCCALGLTSAHLRRSCAMPQVGGCRPRSWRPIEAIRCAGIVRPRPPIAAFRRPSQSKRRVAHWNNRLCKVFRSNSKAAGSQPTALPSSPFVPFSWTASCGLSKLVVKQCGKLHLRPSARAVLPARLRNIPAPTKKESAKNLGQLFDHRTFVSGHPPFNYPRYNPINA